MLSNFIVGVIYPSLKCLCNFFLSTGKVLVWAGHLAYPGYCRWYLLHSRAVLSLDLAAFSVALDQKALPLSTDSGGKWVSFGGD